MAKKLGNDYRPWIETATAGTYVEIKGNSALKINRNANFVDTSTKSDFPYGTQAPGLRALTIDGDMIPDLPDAGYTRFEELANAAETTTIGFQIRKGGATGGSGDVVFEAEMYIGNFNTDMGQNNAVKVDYQLALAAAPTVDELA